MLAFHLGSAVGMHVADHDCVHAAQLQAEKVLRTWIREKVFAADILADYEVSPRLTFSSSLSSHCSLQCNLHCNPCQTM